MKLFTLLMCIAFTSGCAVANKKKDLAVHISDPTNIIVNAVIPYAIVDSCTPKHDFDLNCLIQKYSVTSGSISNTQDFKLVIRQGKAELTAIRPGVTQLELQGVVVNKSIIGGQGKTATAAKTIHAYLANRVEISNGLPSNPYTAPVNYSGIIYFTVFHDKVPLALDKEIVPLIFSRNIIAGEMLKANSLASDASHLFSIFVIPERGEATITSKYDPTFKGVLNIYDMRDVVNIGYNLGTEAGTKRDNYVAGEKIKVFLSTRSTSSLLHQQGNFIFKPKIVTPELCDITYNTNTAGAEQEASVYFTIKTLKPGRCNIDVVLIGQHLMSSPSAAKSKEYLPAGSRTVSTTVALDIIQNK